MYVLRENLFNELLLVVPWKLDGHSDDLKNKSSTIDPEITNSKISRLNSYTEDVLFRLYFIMFKYETGIE